MVIKICHSSFKSEPLCLHQAGVPLAGTESNQSVLQVFFQIMGQMLEELQEMLG